MFQIRLKVCTALSAPDPPPANVEVAHHLVRDSQAFTLGNQYADFSSSMPSIYSMQHSLKKQPIKQYPSAPLLHVRTNDLNSECFLRSLKKLR